jgi:hypothetical protein
MQILKETFCAAYKMFSFSSCGCREFGVQKRLLRGSKRKVVRAEMFYEMFYRRASLYVLCKHNLNAEQV